MPNNLLLHALTAQCALYNLPDEEERKKSNIELTNLFANIVAHSEIESLFEIGALYAEISLFLKNRVNNVVAFEASPRNYKLCREKVTEIEYLNLAISDYDGECEINAATTDGANIGADSLLDRADNSTTEYRKEKVSCSKLDTFNKSKGLLNTSNALWIDVEGLTYKVLLGAKETLKNTKVILVELEQATFWHNQSKINEVNSFLCDNGFIPIARDFEYENQYNVVYVSEDILHNAQVDVPLQMFYSRYASGTRHDKN